MGSGGEPLAGHQPGQEMHAHMTKNETHLHQHHVSAPNIYQHSQTVNVVNTGPSTEEVAAYASARHDAIINQLQAGHVEEKGRLYQDAMNHINVCQQEAMAKEREFNEARQQWIAQRSEAEQKYERLKLIWEVTHSKQKEDADRNAAEMREIIMKQSRDIEALRHELRSRSEQSSSSNVPIFGLRPKASPVQTFPPPGLDLSSKVRVRSDSTELRRDGPGAADNLDGDAGDYEPTSPAQERNDDDGKPLDLLPTLRALHHPAPQRPHPHHHHRKRHERSARSSARSLVSRRAQWTQTMTSPRSRRRRGSLFPPSRFLRATEIGVSRCARPCVRLPIAPMTLSRGSAECGNPT